MVVGRGRSRDRRYWEATGGPRENGAMKGEGDWRPLRRPSRESRDDPDGNRFR